MDWIYALGAFLTQAQTPIEQIKIDPGAMPKVPVQPGNIIITILQVVYCIICVALVVIVMTQTSKSEGLSGMLGGSTQSIFRGKKSFEEKLNTITTWVAGGFIIGSFVIFMIIKHLMK
jgi:preprotein translocase subunit SecG